MELCELVVEEAMGRRRTNYEIFNECHKTVISPYYSATSAWRLLFPTSSPGR